MVKAHQDWETKQMRTNQLILTWMTWSRKSADVIKKQWQSERKGNMIYKLWSQRNANFNLLESPIDHHANAWLVFQVIEMSHGVLLDGWRNKKRMLNVDLT
jgi:hypothetical protein